MEERSALTSRSPSARTLPPRACTWAETTDAQCGALLLRAEDAHQVLMGGVGALPSGGGARQAPEGTEDLQVPAGEGVRAPDTGGVARHSSGGAPPRPGGETTGDKEPASTLNFPYQI